MKGQIAFVLLLGSILCFSYIDGLSVLSFNIRQFGLAKYAKQDVVDILIEIIQDYDMIFIIELVDPHSVVLPGFVKQLNKSVESEGFMFDYVVSERVGRTNYKEQYAVLFRTNVVQVLDTFQYEDIDDIFQRPPYSVHIKAINKQSRDLPPFFIIVVHTQPTDTANEIDGLLDFYNSAVKYYETSAGMILGDLNADCSYLSNSRYRELKLYQNTSFTWWIDKTVDTTSGPTDCAYDRIITSSSLTPYVVNGSVGVIEFDVVFDLDSEFTASVSDHYPVTISLEGNAANLAEKSVVLLWICSLVIVLVNSFFL